MLAIFWAALGPSLLHALRAENGPPLAEVCTSAGAKRVTLVAAADEQVPAPGDAHGFEHCPCCLHHAKALAFPAAPLLPVPSSSLSQLLPAAFLGAPRTLYAWLSAQPRAPPQRC